MRKRLWPYLYFGIFLLACVNKMDGLGLEKSYPNLRSGDLLFLALDCGDLCRGIEEVTLSQFSVEGPRLSHVGILMRDKETWFVYEAWAKVQKTELDKVLARVKGQRKRVFVRSMHLDPRQQTLLHAHLQESLGLPYDADFLKDNGAYYCSELVAEMFNQTLGETRFVDRPMYYGKADGRDASVWKIWKNYFEQRGQEIPVGKPGVSPLGIYLETLRTP